MRTAFVLMVAALAALPVAGQEAADEESVSGQLYCPDSEFAFRLVTISVDGSREELLSERFPDVETLVRSDPFKPLELGFSVTSVAKRPECFAIDRKPPEQRESAAGMTSIRLIFEDRNARVTTDYDPGSASRIMRTDDVEAR
jgi:hypothetical protein